MIRIFLPLMVAVLGTTKGDAAQHEFFHEHVLGTTLQLTVFTDDAPTARRAEKATLEEIDRLEVIFSEYRPDSEFSRLLKSPIDQPRKISPELAKVLSSAEDFRKLTGGAFDPRAGEIQRFWQQQLPADPHDAERRQLIASLAESPYQLTAQHVHRNSQQTLSLNAIAKGYILDQVGHTVLQEVGGVKGLIVNIGGDLRKFGNQQASLGITDPHHAAENDTPLTTWTTDRELAVATSGTYRRKIELKSGKIDHLFDPRTALPITSNCSASVIAPDALTADALATAMTVMEADASIRLAESLDKVECLIVRSTGQVYQSTGWPASPTKTWTVKKEKEAAPGLHVWFKLDRPGGGRYRRPYVAIWLEDKDGFPVKTALLWMQTEQPGPRWHRDLTRWYRNDRMRKLAEKTDLIKTMAGATRGPGEYEAHFDGTDNVDQPLPPGTYTLCLEAARENGTYKIIRHRIDWGSKPIEKTELEGNIEIPQAAFQLVPPAPQG